VGSRTFDGVRFSIYSHEHLPPHVHGTASGVIVVLDLLGAGKVELSKRKDAITPPNAKKNVVARIQRIAESKADDLMTLWEKTHGPR
jgi:hypothetical protein